MCSRGEIKSVFLKTDVTAVTLYKENYILAGIGQQLLIYRIADNSLIYTGTVFEGQRIHGIVIAPEYKNNVAIFGGKDVKVYNIDINTDSDKDGELLLVGNNLNKHISLNDWIISLIWTTTSQISILTAHNVVQVCDVNTMCLLSTQYVCEEKCILYSGSLYKVNDGLVILSGTAFSQICIWSTHGEAVYHRLTGHKGVIFSVSFDKENHVIVSTSDDRSVRVWSVTSDVQDTECLDYWRQCQITLTFTLFGHTARVMQHKSVDKYIISIAEDTMMCMWSLQGHLISKTKVCPNGALWCLDCDAKNKRIVIGGSDSGITLLPLTGYEPVTKCLEFKNGNLTAKRVVLTNQGNIVCVTEEGDVMYYNTKYDIWQLVHTIHKEKTYLCVSLCKQFVAIVSIDGHLDIFVESCKSLSTLSHFISQDLQIKEKILSVHWVYDRCLVICDASGVITVFGSQGLGLCINVMTFNVPKSKQRWLTAAALDTTQKQILIVGDRCGNVHVFKKGNVDAVQSLNKLHGNIGVTLIDFCGDRVVTAGRNGLIKLMILKVSNGSISLSLLYNIKAPFDWIEHFLDKDKNIVCGFKETNLNIWNCKTQSNIIDINCGGGHRSWDIMKSWLKDKDGGVAHLVRLAYIKNSKVMLVNVQYDDVEPKRISSCYHSRDIICCKVICRSNIDYFISGGENTNVNISSCKIINEKYDFEDLAINIYNHLSNVRCMCLIESDVKRYYLYSGGGRAQLCCLMIECTDNVINCYDLASYMLKGTDLEKKKKKSSWSKVETDPDVETRIMSLNCLENKSIDSDEYIHTLMAGCSDGFIRIFKINYDTYNDCNIILDATIDYHKKCVLNVHSFKVNDKTVAISLAVDGTIAFWDCSTYINLSSQDSLEFKSLYSKRIHKAGINAFDFKMIDENSFILASGGDDNVLNINVFKCFESAEGLLIENVSNWSWDKYHCSQITGVTFCENNTIISVSIDQRITLLKWMIDNEELTCEFVKQYCCSIPNVQGLTIIKDNGSCIRLCVFGKGIEIIDISLSC